MSRAAKAGGGVLGTLLLALNVWQQFERTELHDRVVSATSDAERAHEVAALTDQAATRAVERAVAEIQSSRVECGEATGQLARLVNTCADWCAGE